jgi:hypothetical protein
MQKVVKMFREAENILRGALVVRFFLVFEGRHLFEILGLKDLAAILASEVIDPVAPHQELRVLVLTTWHT